MQSSPATWPFGNFWPVCSSYLLPVSISPHAHNSLHPPRHSAWVFSWIVSLCTIVYTMTRQHSSSLPPVPLLYKLSPSPTAFKRYMAHYSILTHIVQAAGGQLQCTDIKFNHRNYRCARGVCGEKLTDRPGTCRFSNTMFHSSQSKRPVGCMWRKRWHEVRSRHTHIDIQCPCIWWVFRFQVRTYYVGMFQKQRFG